MPAEITMVVAGASCCMARACSDLGIVETLNLMIPWDEHQCKVSPGTRIVALIVNILVQRRPLYLVSEFYEAMDLPLLFSEAVAASDLNDDALGRALDRMHEANPKSCFQPVAAGAVSRGHLGVRSVYADTTSVAPYGEFAPTEGDRVFQKEHPERPLLTIMHGHSKQHRPDLKQFVYGLVVRPKGCPCWGT